MTYNPLYKSAAAEQAIMTLYDEALSHWPVPYHTRLIPTRHGDTFVIACGDEGAPPLVLLHGAGTNSAIWIGDVAQYSQRYRVYAVDLLGEAGKSAPNRPPWETPTYAEWLADVLDALAVEQATLVGISQGGWTALKFGVAQPERVTSLALLCPGGVTADRMSFLLRAVVYSLFGRWGVRRMIRLLYAQQPIPAGVEEVFTAVMKGFNARLGVLPLFTDAELARLRMPVLLLGGDQDALRDMAAIAARLHRHLPRLTVSIIPGAGHALVDTVDRVMGFLSEIELPGRFLESRHSRPPSRKLF